MAFVTHLEAALDQTILPADRLQTLHNGRPLWVRYDLAAVRRTVCRDDLAGRPASMWRYAELLPIPGEPVSLGETVTPLLPVPRLGAALQLRNLWIKDEARLPTGSFKSRGMAMAVTMAQHFGVHTLATPTAGNAGSALAAYGARAGLDVVVFMPVDTPTAIQAECHSYGAQVVLVEGLITDCGRLVRAACAVRGWFDVATLKEPYRIEGKKTMGLELAEQCDWQLPDAILYPTGGGTGLIGMWKAFAELQALGWLRDERKPRMYAVQSDGCAPIVRAFETGARFAEPWIDASTIAWGLRVPVAVGDFMILDAVRASGGRALAVPESALPHATRAASAATGLCLCEEAGACVLAAEELAANGELQPDDKVVIFNTGSALKYDARPPADLLRVSADAELDFNAL